MWNQLLLRQKGLRFLSRHWFVCISINIYISQDDYLVLADYHPAEVWVNGSIGSGRATTAPNSPIHRPSHSPIRVEQL